MSSEMAVCARGLGKAYTIVHGVNRRMSFRETLMDRLRHPFRRLETEKFWALRGLSFDVAPGSVVGVIGRNGAGKSTLLKVLSRITEPTTGVADLYGRVGSLLEVGTGFHPELTGRENIYLSGAVLGMRKREIDQQFDQIVDFAEIEKFLDTPVKRYSSGMYVRLAFAVAAHLSTEILIVDEVLAVGDAQFQKKCLGKMREVSRGQGRTVLFVSHNMAAVEHLCTHGIVLEQGRIAYNGLAQDAVTYYVRRALEDVSAGKDGYFDLTRRANLYVPGHLLIRGVQVADEADRAGETIRMGGGLTVTVELDGLCDYPGAQVGLAIRSSADAFLAHFTMAMKPAKMNGRRSRRELAVARLPKLNLAAGTYMMDVAVAVDPVRIFDYVERAAQFHITEADVYGTGYRIKPEQGVIFLDGEWEILPDEPSVVPARVETEAVAWP